MEEIENFKEEVEQFLEKVYTAHEQPEMAPISFYIKDIGWIPIRFYVPVISTDGINYIDAIAMDGSFHQIKEDFIIDKRTSVVSPELFETFMRITGESLQPNSGELVERDLYI